MTSMPISRGLTITNPLIQYQSLIRRRLIDNDPAQHRLALKLQDLYHHLKDYEPQLEYSDRLEKIGRAIGESSKSQLRVKLPQHSSQNAQSDRSRFLSSLFERSLNTSSLSLTRSITTQDSALSIQSPKGLLIHGEVGRGKTMLLNLLADSLPTEKKKRFHFNVFMLDIFRRLEQLRIERLASSLHSPEVAYEHSILSMARDLIFKSPIIFLDEFQLPDRAASKLLSSLLTSFFHLGGVLIATSNRLPEELAKASGIEYVPSSLSSRNWMGSRFNQGNGFVTKMRHAPGAADFAQFLEVLKARCDVWEMEGEMDWRREESQSRTPIDSNYQSRDHTQERLSPASENYTIPLESEPVDTRPETSAGLNQKPTAEKLPIFYHLITADDSDLKWTESITIPTSFGQQQLTLATSIFQSSTLKVYGRTIRVPKQYSGITMWEFPDLCSTNLGPADYITLASTYHTLILTDVPILTFLQKNDARRFITLLDALYEAGCRLLIRAAAPPDELFFPESTDTSKTKDDTEDNVYQEMYSEIYQDSTSPFRPNISSYQPQAPSPLEENLSAAFPSTAYSPPLRSVLADEDADFGPVYGNGRGAHSQGTPHEPLSARTAPDFTRVTSALVGEDERFAYKRARSRLWEMTGRRWWERQDFWRPVEKGARFWEDSAQIVGRQGGTRLPPNGACLDVDVAESRSASPFRTRPDLPPRFNFTHFWGMMVWGKKAGRWGLGD